MINEFKVGYYYKYIGNKKDYYWDEDVELISNNKWHKCIEIDGTFVHFENIKYGWHWLREDFIESKYLPEYKIKKLLKEI